MSGTKKTYNIETKNYFELFGMEEKFSISQRSLTAHYKKVTTYIRKELRSADNSATQILLADKLQFAEKAFQTLLNPLERARYIARINGVDADIRDSIFAEDVSLCQELEYELSQATTTDEVELFQDNLKEQSDFIIGQIEKNIDVLKNYEAAASLVGAWYELHDLYEESKSKQKKIQDGITFVAF